MKELKALLILNGEKVNSTTILKLKDESDFILSADGGTDYCVELGIIPDLVIGDLDSISPKTLDILKKKEVPINVFPIKKDKTDSQLSIEYLMDKGAEEITIIGAIGSRIDHTLANILLLKTIKDKGIKGKIVHNNNIIYIIDDELILDKKNGYFVSIIPIESKGVLVSLKGFEYNLSKVKIDFASTLGVSNFVIDEKGYIKVHEGECLVVVSKD
ncbi:MAG: thiamine diphosphokinase [Tissierellia bacterium]|nr:thiamine diphosphokinase [Tissierellia bacterium]